jgi:hypothetical protein
MEMRNFILNGDILSVEAKINGSEYRLGVQWESTRKALR